jgi:polyhydroxyalkanoate synthesis regulator phasin
MATIPQIRSRLLQGFPEPQADLLAHVFVESHDELVTKAELNELTGVVHDLATNVKELSEAQKELSAAQQRTEERVEELAEAQHELAQAQKRTEWAVADLAKQVGGLSNALGGSLEDFACDLVPEILENRWRFVTKSAGPEDLTDGGRHREFDVVVRGEIDGRPVVVVCETKASVSTAEVTKFMKVVAKIRSRHPDADIRPLFFGYKADRKAREMIVKAGAAMIFTRGVMIPEQK